MDDAIAALQTLPEWSSALDERLEAAAALSIRSALDQKRYMLALLRAVVALDRGGTAEPSRVSLTAVRLLFQLACSCNGAEVKTHHGAAEPPVGVILLGYAGSSFKMLEKVEEIYSQNARWRVITAIATGLAGTAAEEAVTNQMANVARLARTCDRLVVHVMSNNGQYAPGCFEPAMPLAAVCKPLIARLRPTVHSGLWVRLLHAHPELGERLCALVLDCGPNRSIFESDTNAEAHAIDFAAVIDGTVNSECGRCRASGRKSSAYECPALAPPHTD